MSDIDDTWTLAGRTWTSRLIIGTGKFKDAAETRAALGLPEQALDHVFKVNPLWGMTT